MVKVRMDKPESPDIPAKGVVEPLKLDRQSSPVETERHNHDSDVVVEPRLRDLPFTLWNIPRYILLALIRLYQATLSRSLPPDTCRFYPTCSHYGYQAIYKYGAIKGGVMATWRVLRCNPFNKGGFDPVP
jgi:putative membrane protein insertion efficiency factor